MYNTSYKNLTGAKPLCIKFDKGNWFIRDYGGTKYLALFGLETYDLIPFMIELDTLQD